MLGEEKKISICFFNLGKSWGGGEEWHFRTATWLRSVGFDPFIVCYRGSPFAEKCKAEALECFEIKAGNLSFLNIVLLFRLIRLFKKKAPSYILMAMPIDVKIGGLASLIANVPHRIFRRGSAIPVKNKAINRLIYKHVITDIIANSKATIKTILQNNEALFPRERIKLLYNAVHIIDKQHQDNQRTGTKLRIGTAGRLEPQKNQAFLIPLAEELKNRDIDFSIEIAGEGSLFDDLQAQIDVAVLNDEVKLIGFQSDMEVFLSRLDVFVLPSKWEGFGYVLAQAMCVELPVIAFDCSNMPELIMDGVNGYLVPPFNLRIFADKIEALSKSVELQKQMGAAGRVFAKQHFDEKTIMNALREYLILLDKND